jgi:hypothetical protein
LACVHANPQYHRIYIYILSIVINPGMEAHALIPVLRMLRLEACYNFHSSLPLLVRPCLREQKDYPVLLWGSRVQLTDSTHVSPLSGYLVYFTRPMTMHRAVSPTEPTPR